jgi:copper chaperone CopZ
MGYCIGHFSSGVCTYIIHQLLPIVFAIWHKHFKKQKMMTHSLAVENIKCGGCVNSIKTALLKIRGVENVNIDKDTETVTIDGTAEKNSFGTGTFKNGLSRKRK